MPDRDELRKILLKERKLLGDFPRVLKLFDFVKNGINEEDAKKLPAWNKSRKYYFICRNYNCASKCTHEWKGVLIDTVHKYWKGRNGCAWCGSKKTKSCYCNSLAYQRPDIVKDWDYKKNKKTNPMEITVKSGRNVYWSCLKKNCSGRCDHKFKAPVVQRTDSAAESSGCPYCAFTKFCECNSNCLSAKHPEVMAIWDFKKNEEIGLDPLKLRPGSNETAHFICNNCPKGHKHIWDVDIRRVVLLKGACPYCSDRPTRICECNSFAGQFPQLLLDWNYEENKDDPHQIFPSIKLDVNWRCVNCHHKWSQRLDGRTSRGSRCPNCTHERSIIEQAMKDLLDELIKTKALGIISYQPQASRPDLKHFKILEFDFELKVNWTEKPIIIEMDGQQHFKVTYWGGHEEKETFKERVQKRFIYEATRDKIKNDYCKKNLFHLLRMSHSIIPRNYLDTLRDFLQEVKRHEMESPQTAYVKFVNAKDYEKQQQLWKEYEIR